MALKEKELRDLLSDEAKKERRALRRATLLITLAALVGLLWLGFSAYKVVKLGHESSKLNTQIQQQKAELTETTQKLEVAKRALSDAEQTLKNIAAGKENPKAQAQKVLPTVIAASKVVNVSKDKATQSTQTSDKATQSTQTSNAEKKNVSSELLVEVEERETSEKISGAEVSVKSEDPGEGFEETQKTNSEGSVRFHQVPPVKIRLQVIAQGYNTYSGFFTLNSYPKFQIIKIVLAKMKQ